MREGSPDADSPMKQPSPTPEALRAFYAGLGLDLAMDAARSLAAYLDMLVRWNQRMNLVGARSWQEAAELAQDSLPLARLLDQLPLPAAPRVWDLGAGAGLPGIPLRCVWKKGRYWLVEAREKRALFLRQAVFSLKLGGTEVFMGRAEDFMAREGACDVLVSRAFMPWEKLLAFAGPRVAGGGFAVFMLNESLQGRPLPAGWRLYAEAVYEAGGKRRQLCALAPLDREGQGEADA
ncbi:MAG: 16S rRNA (guanine(527)-N(7))-methyltransferase RsmG [Desulfovibrio sp.]|nr:16S rRNA (guanine(527)-N(7))-methyltransferase RsmG [Desulfovibrio sp.]MBQ1844952.1 16S rRNA (guanine(527)-N(7))-methyltransferase RsmG [Desulfovibrio sp.]MBQ4124624.1 16S rRNA (guanine(527)-N(7))-methyltransferase RsmG [Desulfovibrio sp.]